MRILHVGFGYTPFRSGGLIEYAEDLMAAQVVHGDTVGFFSAGRRYPWFRQPRLWRWKRGGVQVFELVNSPLVIDAFGSKDPALDVQEPHSEQLLREVIRDFRPEVIHIQELASLPASVIDVAQAEGIPTVMTLQDYLPLCPTFRLYDYRGEICLQKVVGHKCVPCCAALSSSPQHLVKATLHYDLTRLFGGSFVSVLRSCGRALRGLARVGRSVRSGAAPPAGELSDAQEESGTAAQLFQQRREVMISTLAKVDVLVAQSTRVAEIYRELGVAPDRLQTLHLTVGHLSSIRFRPRDTIRQPVIFVTMNSCSTIAKGALLLKQAVEILVRQLPENSFRLRIYGTVMPAASDLLRLPPVEYRGVYQPHELNEILDEADVGLIPSLWEEAYGYVGVEMLAKGIPIIGNRIGGIPDYVRPGATGWLNDPNTAEGLAGIMAQIIEQPEQVITLNRAIGRSRSRLVKTMSMHRGEIEERYKASHRTRFPTDEKAGCRTEMKNLR